MQQLPPNCTLVTACYDMYKFNKHCRTIDESIDLITPLLKIPVYLVIYGTKKTIPLIEYVRNSFGFQSITKYICQEFDEIWTYQYLDQVKINREQYWPTKDARTCAESHIVCCNKFDFVLNTININPFNTTHFGWIDAFVGRREGGDSLRICENYRPNTLLHILHKLTESPNFHIQVLNVNDKKFLKPENKREYYEHYRWVVCGTFFATARDIGIKILTRLKEIFIETTMPKAPLTYGFGHGEEMFYLEILEEYMQNPDDSNQTGVLIPSFGDYCQILDNIFVPTANIWYVYNVIILGFKKMGYWKEYELARRALLKSANTYHILLDQEIYKDLQQQN